MADISTSIYGGLLAPPPSAVDYANQYGELGLLPIKRQLMGTQLQDAQGRLMDAQTVRGENDQIRTTLSGLGPQASLNDQASALFHLGTPTSINMGNSFLTSYQGQLKAQAQAAKDSADAGKTTADTQWSQFGHHLQSVLASSTPEAARAAVADGVRQGYWSMNDATARINSIPNDQAGFQAWRLAQMATLAPAADALNATKPQFQTRNTGGTTDTLRIDPITGNVAVVGSVNNTASPDSLLQAYTSRSNNQAGIAKDYAIAGLNGDGTPNVGNLGSLVDQLGQYRLNPSLALQRLPIGQRAALVAQIQAKYPNWDETQYDAKKGAAAQFTYGQLGSVLRNAATSVQHMDQLDGLISALGNGNNNTVNAIGNTVSAWNGGTAPTNFDAAKSVVANEVTKAITGGASALADRKDLMEQLNDAKSPQQLRGVLSQWRSLLTAQRDNLLAQRRAAGLSDATLPNYGAPTPQGDSAGGQVLHFDAQGNLIK